MVDVILRYFPYLSDIQAEQFKKLKSLYETWNTRINVISRKDIGNFYIHHVLHSLSIAKFVSFGAGTKILDAGTGGGFPGIPLAIMFPSADFTLLDSIGKKIKVVSSVSEELGLVNVFPVQRRIEEEREEYDFVLCRAVTAFPSFAGMVQKNIRQTGQGKIRNGIIYLKGGDLGGELAGFKGRIIIKEIKDYFTEPYFETKKLVYLPV